MSSEWAQICSMEGRVFCFGKLEALDILRISRPNTTESTKGMGLHSNLTAQFNLGLNRLIALAMAVPIGSLSLFVLSCAKPLDASLKGGSNDQSSVCGKGTNPPCPSEIKIVSQSPASIQVVEGSPLTISVLAQGYQLTYQWYKDSQSIAQQTNSGLSISSADLGLAGSYHVAISDGYGGIKLSNPIAVSVVPATNFFQPILTQEPSDVTVNTNQTATFAVTVSANPAPTYQWYYQGAPIANETGPTLKVYGATPAMSGIYSVLVQNNVGSVSSRAAKLTVTDCVATGIKFGVSNTIANSVLAGWPISNLVDNNPNSAYSSVRTESSNPGAFQIQSRFSASKNLKSVKLYPRLNGTQPNCFPSRYEIYGALDNTFNNWQRLGIYTTQPAGSAPVTLSYAGTSGYFGILINPIELSADSGGGIYLQFGEIEVYDNDPRCL